MATEMTWLGHGSWSLESGGARVVIDPFLDDSPVALHEIGPGRS